MESNIEEEHPKKVFSNPFESKPSSALLGGIMLIVFILCAGFLLGRNILNKTKTPEKEVVKEKIGTGTVVYGYWKGDKAVISAVDLSTSKNTVLSILPTNVKHIRILDGNRFLYLGETDKYDYARKIMLHTIDPPNDETVYEAETGFGIDDYVVSENGNYAALWMVGIPDGSQQFLGDKSKVYSLEINSKKDHLIFNEESGVNKPIHYPLAITNSGKIFLDQFLPNSGAGWGYGMSTADLLGGSIEDIKNMKNGTYSTQPMISSDGKYFAFAGYSGSDGAVEEGGFRRAMVSPDTLEILNTDTLERKKIDTGLSDVLYSRVGWDPISQDLLASATQRKQSQVEKLQLSYSVGSATVDTVKNPNPADYFVSRLSSTALLFGEYFRDREGVGNLGPKYSSSYSRLSVMDPATEASVSVPFDQQPIQLVAIEPSSFFPIVANGKEVLADASNQLQLQTFEFKPTLAPVREHRQSSPVPPPVEVPTSDPPPACRTISYPQCNELMGTDYPVDKDLGDINDPGFNDCVWQQKTAGEADGSCMDSPLYLYGSKGQKVLVNIGTQISNPNVDTKNNTFLATLGNNGSFNVSGIDLRSVTFDYISKVKKLPDPATGFLVKKEDLAARLMTISEKLKLNGQEASDVIQFANKVKAPYIRVSIYDDKLSKEILPLYFNPTPDVYRNFVFYFKKYDSKPQVSIPEPILEPIKREGFTAIEISYIIK